MDIFGSLHELWEDKNASFTVVSSEASHVKKETQVWLNILRGQMIQIEEIENYVKNRVWRGSIKIRESQVCSLYTRWGSDGISLMVKLSY